MTDQFHAAKLNAIRQSEFFRDLDEAVLREIEHEFKQVTLEPGAYVFREGEAGDSMYIVGRGKVRVCGTAEDGSEVLIDEHSVGACVGEIALLTGQPRTATVYTLQASDLIQLSKHGLMQIANRYPQVALQLTSAILPRLQRMQVAHILNTLFGKLESDVLKALQAEMQWVELHKGEVLFRQGEVGDGLYIVVTGRVQIVYTEEDGHERLLAEASVGETVGEVALITGDPRSATIVAARDSNLVKLPTALFERLLDEYPRMMTQITRILMRRQMRMLKGVHATRSYNYALIPLSHDLPLRVLTDQLAAVIARFGTAIPLDSSQFDALYGVDGASQLSLTHPLDIAIARWMNDIDFRYEYVLYVGDPNASPWTTRCLAQADRVILLASADDLPTVRPIERLIAQRFPNIRTELVLLHPSQTTVPQGAAAWLDVRTVERHHHIRRDEPQHVRRLGRLLTGNGIGLVLSGGGARGYAHVGAIRALQEAGVEIDAIGGTSMGAVVAAGYALKQAVDSMFQIAEQFASTRKLFDPTLPLVALNRAAKLTAALKAVFADTQIEDLWLPYFCISTNLTRAEPIKHQRGLLRQAVRGSLSIPAVFPPLQVGGELLVDGGAMNNFPVDVMADFLEGGMVIGCTVSPIRDAPKHPFDLEDSISGWTVLLNRLLRRNKRVPTLAKTILRSLEVSSVYRVRTVEDQVDLLIRPDASQYSILEFDASGPLFELGYAATQAKLKDWLPTYHARYG